MKKNRIKGIKLYLALYYYIYKNEFKAWLHIWIRKIKMYVLEKVVRFFDKLIKWLDKKIDKIDDNLLRLINNE